MNKALSIVKGRLLNSIHYTAQFGAKGVWGSSPTETGVCRLSLSDLDKTVRDWFINETKSLGCNVKVDSVGNILLIIQVEMRVSLQLSDHIWILNLRVVDTTVY